VPKTKRQESQIVALVTGASRGLGLELSKQLIQKGWHVFGVSRSQAHWATAKKKIPSKNFHLIQADVSSASSVADLFQLIKKTSPRIDLLVNSAAYGGSLQRIEETSAEEFEMHLKQNLLSVFLMCRAAFPFLKKSKSPLVMNVSSMAGVRGVPKIAGYSASKFGVLAMTEVFAKENLEWLKVVTICPGGMNTKMRSDLFGKEDAARQQTPAFVSEKMMQILNDEIPVLTASHVVIRHGKITQIMVPPNS
jgi:NAD(P)-dependent dehydrogenase (short-subunit alcohol dehydrogenase family)